MHQTLRYIERKSICCQRGEFHFWLQDSWPSCNWVTGLKSPLMFVKLLRLYHGQDHEVLPLGIWLREHPENFYNDVVCQQGEPMNMPIWYELIIRVWCLSISNLHPSLNQEKRISQRSYTNKDVTSTYKKHGLTSDGTTGCTCQHRRQEKLFLGVPAKLAIKCCTEWFIEA